VSVLGMHPFLDVSEKVVRSRLTIGRAEPRRGVHHRTAEKRIKRMRMLLVPLAAMQA
jgi:hypothetical protein